LDPEEDMLVSTPNEEGAFAVPLETPTFLGASFPRSRRDWDPEDTVERVTVAGASLETLTLLGTSFLVVHLP